MTNSDSTPHTLFTPGSVMANLPAILGFYPKESIVFAFLFQDENRSTRYEMGPIIRIDLLPTELFFDALQEIKGMNADLIFCYLITENMTYTEAQNYGRELQAAAYLEDIDVTAGWLLPEILTGAPYELVFGPTSEDDPESITFRTQWESGTVSSIVAAPSMQPYRDSGELPQASRDDAFAFFCTKPRGFHPSTLNWLYQSATQTAWEFENAIRHDTGDDPCHMIDVLIDDWFDLLSEADSLEIADFNRHTFDGDTGENDDFDQTEELEDILYRCAPYFASTLLRDLVMHSVQGGYSNIVAEVSLAVARIFHGEIRANALCFYALCAISQGLNARATQALSVSIDKMPSHRLTALLVQGLHLGAFETLLESVVESSHATWQHLGCGVENSA